MQEREGQAPAEEVMPTYTFVCGGGHRFERVLPLSQYDTQQWCDCGRAADRVITATMLAPDIQPYTSPIDGRWINSRVQRHEDLKRSGCVEYEPSMQKHMRKAWDDADKALDAAVDQTVEREIAVMPTRKREKLAAEMQGGMDIELVRKSANG